MQYTALSNQLHHKMFTTMSHWSGSRPLAHQSHWTLTETPLGYPAVALSHVDPVAIIPQDKSLHTLQQVINGVDVGWVNPKLWMWV